MIDSNSHKPNASYPDQCGHELTVTNTRICAICGVDIRDQDALDRTWGNTRTWICVVGFLLLFVMATCAVVVHSCAKPDIGEEVGGE